MKKNTKKTETQLPKFKANTLGPDELCQVTGGFTWSSGGTGNTRSICHVDGKTDNDD